MDFLWMREESGEDIIYERIDRQDGDRDLGEVNI